jgi:hypothetical protein
MAVPDLAVSGGPPESFFKSVISAPRLAAGIAGTLQAFLLFLPFLQIFDALLELLYVLTRHWLLIDNWLVQSLLGTPGVKLAPSIRSHESAAFSCGFSDAAGCVSERRRV